MRMHFTPFNDGIEVSLDVPKDGRVPAGDIAGYCREAITQYVEAKQAADTASKEAKRKADEDFRFGLSIRFD